jgi:hypothetical protein
MGNLMETILGLLVGGGKGLYAMILGSLGALSIVAFSYFKGRADARAKADIARLNATVKAVTKATKTRKDIANETDAALADRISKPRKL